MKRCYLGPDGKTRAKTAHVAYLRQCARAWEALGDAGQSQAYDEADRVAVHADELEGVTTLRATDPKRVEGILGALDEDEKTTVLILYGCTHLPIADLSGRYRALGILNERSTLSRLGRAIAKRLLEDDPEARDHE